MNCPFCSTEKFRSIREGKTAIVILSNPRLVKGHLLIIPKRHVEKFWDLNDAEIYEIFSYLKIFQKKLSKVFGTGCDIRQNYRPFIAQNNLKVDHIHFHLIPRTFKDEIYLKSQIFEPEIFKDLANEEILEVVNLL